MSEDTRTHTLTASSPWRQNVPATSLTRPEIIELDDADALAAIAADVSADEGQLRAVARNQHCPMEALESIWSRTNTLERAPALANPACPREWFEEALAEVDPHLSSWNPRGHEDVLLTNMAANPALDRAMVEDIAGCSPVADLVLLDRDDLSAEAEMRIARGSAVPTVLRKLAGRTTNLDTLLALVRRTDVDGHLDATARNPHLRPTDLEQLCSDPSAQHRSAAVHALFVMTFHGRWWIDDDALAQRFRIAGGRAAWEQILSFPWEFGGYAPDVAPLARILFDHPEVAIAAAGLSHDTCCRIQDALCSPSELADLLHATYRHGPSWADAAVQMLTTNPAQFNRIADTVDRLAAVADQDYAQRTAA
ncbi:MAG: hypothetical protein GY882_10575 [Actinomycetia bacterium]|nr:hypothetical protein [Actinomycetes bacterium]